MGASNRLPTTRKPVIWGYLMLPRIGPGRRRTLSFRRLCLHHGAGRQNGLLQGALKQLAIKWFEGVLLSCLERLQVWNACFQEHWTKCMVAFSAPPCPPRGKGGAGGSKDTQEQFAIQHLNAWLFLLHPHSPQSLCGWWRERIEMAQTALRTMADQERQGKWGRGEWRPE